MNRSFDAPGTTPAHDDFALANRATPLTPVIAAEIAERGPMTFARFMSLALGHPEHGYYSRPDLAWGAAGDFETSPEVHPVFGYLWARQILECWERLGRPAEFALVEPGAGSGAFAVAILTWLRERAPECAAAARPVILDGHPRRVEHQRARLRARGLEAKHALLEEWLARDEHVTGVVISNELFDALPVHLVERREGALHEWYVAAGADGAFVLEPGPTSTADLEAHFERLRIWPGEECRAEVSLAAPQLMRALAGRLERGYVLTIDYGYEAELLYASWRRMGTLMAFRHHSPQPDPLALPGLTDLTAHVDFTSLAGAGAEAGFEPAPLVSQAEALMALGIGEALEAARARAAEDFAAFASARRAAETLLDPAGLGRIRVLAMAKGAPLEGLACLRSPEGYRAASR
ncbi:MAG: SAM-dependent methyltransferase [Dehalococcoidia bacterium]|nr:SAM-dependent methyltransferase [Dehalococcoidia bacterium]